MKQKEHLHEMIKRTQREFDRKYCLHPDAPDKCSSKIISAHSVQRALLKKFISQHGHVVQIKVSAHVEPVGSLAKPELVGIHNATTFSGFCGKHDTELFSPLEVGGFNFTRHQVSLLGYRAVCRELYMKQAEIACADALSIYCAVNPEMPVFPERERRHKLMQAARRNAASNLSKTKDCYAEMVKDDSALRFYAVEFTSPPIYLNSVSFLPEWDFEGHQLQDLSYLLEYKPICFSAWAAEQTAAAVFCWHESADTVCKPFIDSLRRSDTSNLANRILSMAFEVSDNVVFREDWWESLSEDNRQLIIQRAFSGGGMVERTNNSLLDDGLRAITTQISNEYVSY